MNQSHNQMTIAELYILEHWGKTYSNTKVSVENRNGKRYVHIHDHEFDNYADALNYLRQDARNIAAPRGQ
jgi:hypothetical protein